MTAGALRQRSQDSENHDEPVVDVIVNPAAGAGRAGKHWPEYERELVTRGYVVRAHITTGPGDATVFARRIAETGGDTLLCVGGDGTVNEVINGLIHQDVPLRPELRLGIISCGTGRDLCRTLGTQDVNAALDALDAETIALIDVGRMQFLDPRTDHLETRYFVNVADAGIGAATAERINASSKRLGGFVSYLNGAIQTIARYEPWEAVVEVDGEEVFAGHIGMVVFANGRYFAGGMLVAPDASLCDGLLDIWILEDVGKRRLITGLLPRVYRGKHVGQPGVTHLLGSEARVRVTSTMSIEMDGEQAGLTPLTVSVVPRVLRVYGNAAAIELAGSCADDSEYAIVVSNTTESEEAIDPFASADDVNQRPEG